MHCLTFLIVNNLLCIGTCCLGYYCSGVVSSVPNVLKYVKIAKLNTGLYLVVLS